MSSTFTTKIAAFKQEQEKEKEGHVTVKKKAVCMGFSNPKAFDFGRVFLRERERERGRERERERESVRERD